MFYIFLDVDGVLNKQSDWKYNYYIDKKCINVLKNICEKLNKKYFETRIVLISTWRAGASDTNTETKQIQKLKNNLKEAGLSIYGCTPISSKGRQAEIEYYIRRNNVENYIVIDDDNSLYDNISDIIYYKPDYKTGLVPADVKKIMKLFR